MLSPKSLKELLKNVLLHADLLGIKSGVAAVVVVNIFTAESITEWLPLHGKIERPPNPDIIGDIGTNFFGTAFAKLAETLLIGKDSGSTRKTPRQGELGYAGGITWQVDNLMIHLAFAGGETEEQDLKCVQFAKKKTKL